MESSLLRSFISLFFLLLYFDYFVSLLLPIPKNMYGVCVCACTLSNFVKLSGGNIVSGLKNILQYLSIDRYI